MTTSKATKPATLSKLFQVSSAPASAVHRRVVVHLTADKPSNLRSLRRVDNDDPSSPVRQIVGILNSQDFKTWKTNNDLNQLLFTSPSLSANELLRIAHRLSSSYAALRLLEHLSSEKDRLQPGSLSSIFEAAFELGFREPKPLEKLWYLVKRSVKMGVPLNGNSAAFLIGQFSESAHRSMGVYNAVDPGSRNNRVRKSLLGVLVKCGCVGDALKVLDEMLEPRNEVSANGASGKFVMRRVLNIMRSKDGFKDEGIVDLVKKLGERGVFLDSRRLQRLISAFVGRGNDAVFDLLHCYLKLGAPVDDSCCNLMLSDLARKGELQRINLLLKVMKANGMEPSITLFRSLINQLCKSGRINESLGILRKMTEESTDGIKIQPDVVVYNMIINGLCKLGRLEEGLALMEEMRMKMGGHCRPDTITYTCLIDGFFKDGEMNKSLELFEEMKKEGVEPSFITINVLIDGLCKNGMVMSALKFFNELKGKGFKGNEKTYTTLITAFCSASNINGAMQLFDEMKEKCNPDAIAYSNMILGLCEAGRMDDACSFMATMKEAGFPPDVKCYNVMINGFCKKEMPERMYELLEEMENDGIKPNRSTYNTLISYFSKTGDFQTTHAILERMNEDELKPDALTYGVLIHAFCSSGDLDEAVKVFSKMGSGGRIQPNVVIYNTLIYGYCRKKKLEAALCLFDEMEAKGLKPDIYTFNALFRGLRGVNRLDKAFELMDRMISQCCLPNHITMGILYEWLPSVGETDRLRKFVQGNQVSGLSGEC